MTVLAGMRYLRRLAGVSLRNQPETSIGLVVVFCNSIKSPPGVAEAVSASLITTAPGLMP